MTRTRRAKTFGMPVAAACLLLVLVLLPAPAGAAEEDEIRLPFLLADGAQLAVLPIAPVLLPVWASASQCVGGWDRDLESARLDRRGQDARPEPGGPAYPDVGALLRGLAGASYAGAGRVVLPGAERDRARLARLLGAVRAGFGRRVRIEIEVRRGPVKTLIALSGEAPLGSLLVVDARESRDYPAGLQLEAVSACAEMMCVQVGPRLVASAVRTGSGYVLRLAVHVSRVAGEVRFEAERLTLVAPALAFSSLVVEVPAAPRKSETIRCGDLTITYRVTPLPSTPPPPGTRVFSLDGQVPLFDDGPLPEPGLASRDDREDATALAPLDDPPTWMPGPIDGVRRHDVPPGLVVLEGEEKALEAVAERWRDAWSDRRAPLRLALVSDTGFRLDLPLAPPARLVFVAGRLDPVVRSLESAISTSAVQAGPTLAELFTGRTLTVSFEGDRQPRVTEILAAPATVQPRVIPIVVSKQGIVRRDRLPGSSWAPTITRTSRLCRPDEIRAWREAR